MGILGQVWCLIVSIPDLCPLSYYALWFHLPTGKLKIFLMNFNKVCFVHFSFFENLNIKKVL